MVDEAKAGGTGKEVTTDPITPAETSDGSGNDEAHEEEHHNVVLVLECDDRVLAQVGDIGDTGLATGKEDHPANVRPEKALVRRVRVKFGVGITMVSAVATAPPADGALDGTCASEGEEPLERLGGVVRTMGPKTVVTGRDAWKIAV